MEEKPDKRLLENFPKTERIFEQMVRQIRRTFSQDFGEKVRESERGSQTCKALVSAFRLYLTQLEAHKFLYSHFTKELFKRMPELGLGIDTEQNAWQYFIHPLIEDKLLYPD